MKSYQKTIFLAILMGLFVLGAFANLSATETRVVSMGGVGFYVKDNSNIFFFPGAISMYSGQVIGEFRTKDSNNSYTVGVNYPVNDNSVFGVYLNRPLAITIPAGVVNQVMLTHTTDLLYGMKMSQFDLGFRVALSLDAYKADTTEKESAHYFAFGVGASSEKMDLGLLFELPGVDRKHDDSLENKWNGTAFGFNGRMFYGDKTKIVPVANLKFSSTKADYRIDPEDSGKVDFTTMDLGLGVGLNHQIDNNNLLILGVEIFGLSSLKEKINGGDETTTQTTTIPGLFMGLESQIKPWLTGRIGAAQVFQGTKVTVKPPVGPKSETTTRSSDYKVYFGLGLHFGALVLDAAINEGLFFDGPNFVSGQNNAVANRLSLTYKF
jgi:hypothetical protein